ncbi:MAG: DUF6132 family protein [Candidatus Kapabacteria bacterium]|nr:DUF6132 family protein [Candidatus Kapabacteria bacterium]
MNKSCESNKKQKSLKEFVKSSSFWKPALGVVVGGMAGFAYYHFVGCSSGNCAITSSPYMSTLMGGFWGLMFTNRPCKSC